MKKKIKSFTEAKKLLLPRAVDDKIYISKRELQAYLKLFPKQPNTTPTHHVIFLDGYRLIVKP